MRKVKRHSDETRAAVMGALLAGQGVTEVARQYHIDHSIVSRWKQKIPSTQLHEIARKRGDEFTELLSNAIVEIFKTLAFSVRFVRTADGIAWIKSSSPAEVATFIGVATDKGIRLLEAASQAEIDLVEGASESAEPVPKTVLQ